MKSTAVEFANTARMLGDAARRHGCTVPSFRSPPKVPGRMRTVRRHGDTSVTVSLVVRGRPWSSVMADMIEGFVVANQLGGAEAEQLRDLLWRVVAVDEEPVRLRPVA